MVRIDARGIAETRRANMSDAVAIDVFAGAGFAAAESPAGRILVAARGGCSVCQGRGVGPLAQLDPLFRHRSIRTESA